MRIVDLSLVYNTELVSPEEQLHRHYTTVCMAEALSRLGAEVICLKRFSRDYTTTINEVAYHFVRDGFGHHARNHQFPRRLYRLLRSLQPDVLHFHHLSLAVHSQLIRALLPKSAVLVIQHHGGPIIDSWKKRVHDRLNRVADGFLFTTAEDGNRWFRQAAMQAKVFPVMEGSPVFDFETRDRNYAGKYEDRMVMRRQTDIVGDPVFLWNGRLDENKDPITVLRGFEILAREVPGAKLYLVYAEEKLLASVQEHIKSSAVLADHVKLLGRVERNELEKIYASADYFVLGSHYEGTCYSLSEALRAGCIPIVPNIPAFRAMTAQGRLGGLWKNGDAASFAESAHVLLQKSRTTLAESCIQFFRDHLSYDAIAKRTLEIYQELAEKKKTR